MENISPTLVVSGRMPLTLVVGGINFPYIGGQWEECPWHLWSADTMPLTLMFTGNNAPYICVQCEEWPLHLWSVDRMLLTLMVSV